MSSESKMEMGKCLIDSIQKQSSWQKSYQCWYPSCCTRRLGHLYSRTE